MCINVCMYVNKNVDLFILGMCMHVVLVFCIIMCLFVLNSTFCQKYLQTGHYILNKYSLI